MSLLFFIVSLIFSINGKVVIVLDTSKLQIFIQILFNIFFYFLEIEDCTVGERSDFHDFSKLELIPYNDTHTFFNGTWKILREIKSPWKVRIFAEHYVQGKWFVEAYDKTYRDFCKAFKNPLEPWYDVFKNLQGCPIPARVRLVNRSHKCFTTICFVSRPHGNLI